MNLFEIQEEKNDIEADIKYYKRERERLESKIGVKAVAINDMKVDGGSLSTVQDALDEYTQLGLYLDEAIEKYRNITILANDKYNNYQKHNDYDKQIYVEKKLFHWSNAKISAKHRIGKSQIYNIIEKIENVEKSGK